MVNYDTSGRDIREERHQTTSNRYFITLSTHTKKKKKSVKQQAASSPHLLVRTVQSCSPFSSSGCRLWCRPQRWAPAGGPRRPRPLWERWSPEGRCSLPGTVALGRQLHTRDTISMWSKRLLSTALAHLTEKYMCSAKVAYGGGEDSPFPQNLGVDIIFWYLVYYSSAFLGPKKQSHTSMSPLPPCPIPTEKSCMKPWVYAVTGVDRARSHAQLLKTTKKLCLEASYCQKTLASMVHCLF